MRSSLVLAALVLLSLLVANSMADIYMHNPRGSNNRNCERTDDRQNDNRLFDSQNNGRGGYACPRAQGNETEIECNPDPLIGGYNKRMYYYEGSILPIEWTLQHSCGYGNAECQVIIQYACEDTAPYMKDGIPQVFSVGGGAASDGTTTVPVDPDAVLLSKYGTHETYESYKKCEARQRNKGLWTADQPMGESARSTRQKNNEGDRYGLECPEERDYYPYWHPTMWKDIAIFTSKPEMCDYYQKNSENVKGRGECAETRTSQADGSTKTVFTKFNNPLDCLKADGSTVNEGGVAWTVSTQWVTRPAFGIDPPECLDAKLISSRDNILGTINDGSQFPSYNWTIPTLPASVQSYDRCVIRVRYNMSSVDIKWDTDQNNNQGLSPVKQDSSHDVFGIGVPIETAQNTDQIGRTFQDRSYTFRIVKRPQTVTVAGKSYSVPSFSRIYNVNVRGKRGNIVQTYPAVEYDFVPNRLNIQAGDFIHFQWAGSDYNPPRAPNDAEGGPPDRVADPTAQNNANSGADRTNLVMMKDIGSNMPINVTQAAFFYQMINGKPTIDVAFAKRLALLDQDLSTCMTTKQLQTLTPNNGNANNAQRDVRNCGKQSGQRHPYFDAGLFPVLAGGRFVFSSTRNNNFSNRSQKLAINVEGNLLLSNARSVRVSLAWIAFALLGYILFL